jgi:hypothetical protein
MLYQLRNGRTISISIEQFLELTDEDEQYLVSLNYGDVILSPFFRSAIHSKKELPEYENDESIDFIAESEEVESEQPQIISLDEESLEIPIPEDLE